MLLIFLELKKVVEICSTELYVQICLKVKKKARFKIVWFFYVKKLSNFLAKKLKKESNKLKIEK